MSAPGKYTVELSQQLDGVVTPLGEAQEFLVEPMAPGSLKGAPTQQVVEFWQAISDIKRDASATHYALEEAQNKVKMLALALQRSKASPGNLDQQLHGIRSELLDISHQLNGDASKFEVYLNNVKTVSNLIGVAELGTSFSTYGPTPTHRQSLKLALKKLDLEKAKLKAIIELKIPTLEKQLRENGAPWVKQQRLP